MRGLFDDHLLLVQKVMDLRLIRQNIVASNIANIENPNYKAKRIEFEKQLQEALNLQEGAEMARPKGSVNSDFLKVKPDFHKELEIRVVQGEDAVDLDKEMAISAKNVMAYNALATIMKKELDMLSQVIMEGGR